MAIHSIPANQNNSYRFARFIALLTLSSLFLLLNGCASTQKNIWIDKAYSGKVSELFVRIDGAAMIPHKISLKSRAPKITPEFKAAMNRGTQAALKEMHTVAPACITAALEAHGVNVKDAKDKPAARLIFTPLRVESHSDEYSGVSHKLWYMVVLTDNTTKKQIWRGEFRMYTKQGRNGTVTIKQEELDKFCGAIAAELGNAGLLPK